MYIGEVCYVDFGKQAIPWGNVGDPFFYKRKHFEYERELRAVVPDFPVMEDSATGESFIPLGLRNPHPGQLIKVPVEDLMERVYVAPTAPPWFRTLVERVTRRYGVNKPVVQSSLDEKAVF
jgi:hypothetical protein